MKRSLILTILVVLAVMGLSVGCGFVTGSGNLVSDTYDFSDFTIVEAHNGFQLEITRSTAFGIEITTDDNVQEYLEVNKSGDTLIIRLRGNRLYSSVTLEASITMPELYGIDLSGGSRASITDFSSSHDLSVELSGGSRISGEITAADTDFELSGGSRVDLAGSANDLVVDGSGGSQLDLESFPVDNARIELSGGGSATVNLDGRLDVDLSGGSRVLYVGNPTIGDRDLSGGSTVSNK
ncbi:MAG: DUF2807 domain-containing protein [Dehalococcoidales bacterium]|nr:MAG: DUF2807 domain-containing protein [Dehalococcoidales bacterium]